MTEKNTYSKIAAQYADDVLKNKILSCVALKQACQRFKNDLAEIKKGNSPFAYNGDAVEEVCSFAESLILPDQKKPLKLLLDFVENLDVTNATIEKEKGIILSEYDMYQQSPEQRLFKETLISLFQYHPMKVDVLGSKEDIQDMSMEDLKQFYA